MAWLQIKLSEAEQAIVQEEREAHPRASVRQRMLALWLLHCGVKRQEAAKIVSAGRASVQRWVAAYRDGGLEALRRCNIKGPESEMAAYRDQIREMFTRQPARTIAPTTEHFDPMFVALGASHAHEQPSQVFAGFHGDLREKNHVGRKLRQLIH